jgi:hypothetical protein
MRKKSGQINKTDVGRELSKAKKPARHEMEQNKQKGKTRQQQQLKHQDSIQD